MGCFIRAAALAALLWSVVALGLWPGSALAGTDPEASAEIWVDGPNEVQPGNARTFPDAAAHSDGTLVFVWSPSNAAGGDGWDIFLRRFDDTGTALADPVRVNTTIDNIQRYARVAISGDGSFLVIWQSWEQDPDLAPGIERIFVRSQKYDSAGTPVGGEQLISTLSSGEATDTNADVAALTGGGYVVAWKSRNSPGEDPDHFIQARLVNADGTPSGSQFKANASVGDNVADPSVTQLGDGGFLVVWTVPEVQARRFMANGTPAGADFQVNTLTTGGEAQTDAALHGDGRVMIVWEDDESPGDNQEIRGRIFDSSLLPDGDDFRINTTIAENQQDPRVGAFGAGEFFVAWYSDFSAGSDNDGTSIQGRRVTGSDEFASPEFQINDWTTDNQQDVGLSGADGHLAIAWRSQGNADDPNDDVITGEYWFICGIFCDGFESTE